MFNLFESKPTTSLFSLSIIPKALDDSHEGLVVWVGRDERREPRGLRAGRGPLGLVVVVRCCSRRRRRRRWRREGQIRSGSGEEGGAGQREAAARERPHGDEERVNE